MKPLNTVSTILLGTTIATSFATSSAYAESEGKRAAKSAATFYSAAIIGGMAAGPVGFFLGALGGATLAEKNKEFAETREELAFASSNIVYLQDEVLNKQQHIQKLEKSAVNKLEFAVMFPTGEDTLTELDIQRINTLATYLKDNPQLSIRLDGHTDPRGTDEYNNLLSQERALSVSKAFEERGIGSDRITWYAHGSDLSTAYVGDLEAYALERRVKIEVYTNDADVVAINQ